MPWGHFIRAVLFQGAVTGIGGCQDGDPGNSAAGRLLYF